MTRIRIRIRIGTWNLKRKAHLFQEIQNEYDFKNESIIYWITEPPTNILASSDYKIIQPAQTGKNGKLGCLVLSNDFSISAGFDPFEGDQIFGSKITNSKLPTGTFFYIIGSHLTAPIGGKTITSQIARATLDYHSIKSSSKENNIDCIVLGDFNAEPNDSLMTNRHILACEQDIRIVQSNPEIGPGPDLHGNKVFEKHTARLFNPAMSHTSPPLGTIRVSSGTNNWKLIDQILLASKPSTHYVSSSFRVVDKLGSTKLTRQWGSQLAMRRKVKKRDYFSDHLPVELELEYL